MQRPGFAKHVSMALFSVFLCVSVSDVLGVKLLQHIQYDTRGPPNPDSNSSNERRERVKEVERETESI